ncbi:MAG: dihydrofolate reductase family protein [Clostridiales bacterium]|nr:dihydrofolate reductase family protein [Clostridiales bacterium]
MDRPRIICHMLTSIDGKVTGSFLQSPKAQAGSVHYDELHRSFGADAFACGRLTMEENFMEDAYPDLAPYLDAVVPPGDYIAEKHADFYAVAFDRKGRMGWKSATIQDDNPGYNGAHIVEVVTADAPRPCLAYLRDLGISYILADTVSEALIKLKDRFGICLLLLEGGSELNGSFLREDLVDEISLVQIPVISDPKARPLFGSVLMREARLLSDEIYEDGCIALHYEVLHGS